MTPHELATKIAEEVFKTIEGERAIVKARVVEAVEKVLLLHKPAAYVADSPELERALSDWMQAPMSMQVVIHGLPPARSGLELMERAFREIDQEVAAYKLLGK